MSSKQSQERFAMSVPHPFRQSEQYGFWLTTTEKRLLTAVYAMRCVAGMKRHRPSGRVLVEISDEHDPDEAWHWIRSELEDAVNYVELDSIWEEAIKWIL
ncbi:MAG: hypothetical protein GC179_07290 [Anaerolineaceae bacterium]|nr:hypothetical protein [Anaerolineaceae bacterium]